MQSRGEVVWGCDSQRFHPIDVAVNTVVNNPIKMLVLAAMGQKPQKTWNPAEVPRILDDMQEGEVNRIVRVEEIRAFCATSFLPAGFVRQVTTSSSGEADTFEFTDKGVAWGIPLCGALLDLECSSGFSSQRTFGQINTTSDEARTTMRSPLVRLRILEHVYWAEGQPVSLKQLRGLIPRKNNAVDTAVYELADAGILTVAHKSDPGYRTIALLPSDPDKIMRYKRHMRPEIAGLYDTVVDLYARGLRTINGQDLLEEVAERFPGMKVAAFLGVAARQKLSCIRFDDEAQFGRNTGKDAPRTKVAIAPDQEMLIEELVRTMVALRENADYRKVASRQVRYVLSQKGVVSYLFSKAQANSNRLQTKNKSHERLRRLAGQMVGWINVGQQTTQFRDWHTKAACRTESPNLFFSSGEILPPSHAELARAVCNRCPVSIACLKWAVDRPERYGMWGGKTETERKHLPLHTINLLQNMATE